jgi:hypothetical protein
MDPTAVYSLIPITAIFFCGIIAFSFTRLGRALATRLEGRLEAATEERLAALEAANDELRAALSETQERLDFAERAMLRGPVEPIDTPV